MTEKIAQPRPHEYMDFGGAELEIPAVRYIADAVESSQTFVVVGGGGSGKTESLVTALETSDKNYEMFDLRGWTIGRLSDAAARDMCLADPTLNPAARAVILELEEYFLAEPEGVEDKIWELYRNDTSYGIKYAEGYLLDREIATVQESGSASGESGIPQCDVLILDEFDLGVAHDVASVEIENAVKLIQLAKLSGDAQLGLVVHPPARNNPDFTQSIHAAIAERGEVREIRMGYFPETVQKAALDMVGLDGELAERYMQDTLGMPAAYLDIATQPGFRAALLARNPEEKLSMLSRHGEDKITRNKKVLFDRLSPPTKDYLSGIMHGSEEARPDNAALEESLINLYVTEIDGEVLMAPIVKRALSQENDANT